MRMLLSRLITTLEQKFARRSSTSTRKNQRISREPQVSANLLKQSGAKLANRSRSNHRRMSRKGFSNGKAQSVPKKTERGRQEPLLPIPHQNTGWSSRNSGGSSARHSLLYDVPFAATALPLYLRGIS